MAQRTFVTVLREMQMLRTSVKDGAVREALLAPLEAELKFFAEQSARQGSLSLSNSSSSTAGVAGSKGK